VVIGSEGVGGPDDSVDAGVTSKTRLGRGRRMRGCSVIVGFVEEVVLGASFRFERAELEKTGVSDCRRS
jgi:hypothetical protein